MVFLKKIHESLISSSKILPVKLIIAILLFVVFFSIFLAQNHYLFHSYAWDLGLFNQVFSSTLHGRPFYYTLEPFWSQNNNFQATHFSPIIVIVLPFYALYPNPEILFVIHSATIALGAIAAYKLSYLLLKNNRFAFLFSILYLFNPLVVGQAFSSFHLEGFFLTLMMFTVYFFVKREGWKYFFCLALTLMTIEYAAIPLLFFGVATIFMYDRAESPKRSTKFLIPLITITLSIIYFALAQYIQATLGLIKLNIHQEWSILGANSIFEVPLKIIENPVAALNALSYGSSYKVWYILMVFTSGLFLPLLKPSYLLPTLPWLMIALFSNYDAYYVVSSHYPAFIAPFIFLATIYGFKKIIESKKAKKVRLKKLVNLAIFIKLRLFLFSIAERVRLKKLVNLTMFMVMLLFIFSTILSVRPIPNLSSEDSQHVTKLHEILNLVPDSASILAQDNIFPHVSSRFEAYTIPSPLWEGFSSIATEMLNITLSKNPEYVLIDLKTDNEKSRSIGELIFDTLSKPELNYDIIAEHDGIYLFKVNYTSLPS